MSDETPETSLAVREEPTVSVSSLGTRGLSLTTLEQYQAFARWATWAGVLPRDAPQDWTPDQKYKYSVGCAVVKLQYGAELGFAPMASISNVHVIEGRCSAGAHMIAAVIKGSGRYRVKVVERSAQRCRLNFLEFFNGEWERCSEMDCDAEFTIGEAETAGLIAKRGKNWQRYPKAMLYARAIAIGARLYCADLFGGQVYTPEEMSNGAFVDAIDVRVEPEEPKAPAEPEDPCAVAPTPEPEPEPPATDEQRTALRALAEHEHAPSAVVEGIGSVVDDPALTHHRADAIIDAARKAIDDAAPPESDPGEPPRDHEQQRIGDIASDYARELDQGSAPGGVKLASPAMVRRLRTMLLHCTARCGTDPANRDVDLDGQWFDWLEGALSEEGLERLSHGQAAIKRQEYLDDYGVTKGELDALEPVA